MDNESFCAHDISLEHLLPWGNDAQSCPRTHDPRANIMAGVAYLGDLFDRFGYPALFAAYNAGPGRYDAYLMRGQPLPEETRRYVSAIDKALSSSGEEPPSQGGTTGLFFRLSTHESPPSKASSSVTQGGLFIVRKGQGGGAP